MVEYKKCVVCLESKELGEFPNDKNCRKGKSTRCRECAKEYLKKYYQANKEKAAAYNKERRKNKSAQISATNKAWKAENKERVRRNQDRYYKENKAKFRERNKQWEKDNPEKVKCYKVNYRARRRDAPGSHTGDDLKNLFLTQKGLCVACMSKLGVIYHVDHIQPLSLGGSNDKYNLQLLCGSCNSSKQDKDPIEFMQQRGKLL